MVKQKLKGTFVEHVIEFRGDRDSYIVMDIKEFRNRID